MNQFKNNILNDEELVMCHRLYVTLKNGENSRIIKVDILERKNGDFFFFSGNYSSFENQNLFFMSNVFSFTMSCNRIL